MITLKLDSLEMSAQHCSGDKGNCACRRTRKELDDAKKERVTGAAVGTLFPKHLRLHIVHELEDGTWVCSECGHKIGVHPSESSLHDTTATPIAHSVEGSSFRSPAEIKSELDINEKDFIDAALAKGVKLLNILDADEMPRMPTSGGENKIQQWLRDVADSLKTDLGVTLSAATNPVVTLKYHDQSLKPDGVVYAHGAANITPGIVSVIELKKMGEPLGDSHQLQLLKYLHAVLSNQRHRQWCYGIITNGACVQVWKAVRKPPARGQPLFSLQYQLIYSSATFEAGACIAWLLEMTLANHGFEVLDVKLQGSSAIRHELNNENFIGSGQHCDAYTLYVGDAKEEAVVVKHYRDKAKAEQEREICGVLSDVQNVAHLAADGYQPTDERFVAIRQRGFPFDAEHMMNEHHATCLVAAVTELHNKGIAHCDIFEGNIYWLDEKEAMLNDWSHVKRRSDFEETFEDLCSKDFQQLRKAVKKLACHVEDEAFAVIFGAKRKREEPDTANKVSKK